MRESRGMREIEEGRGCERERRKREGGRELGSERETKKAKVKVRKKHGRWKAVILGVETEREREIYLLLCSKNVSNIQIWFWLKPKTRIPSRSAKQVADSSSLSHHLLPSRVRSSWMGDEKQRSQRHTDWEHTF